MRNVFIGLFALVANLLVAGSQPFVKVSSNESIQIDLAQWNGKELKVTIASINGEIFHTDKFENNHSVRRYNLSKLEVGQYLVTVEDGTVIKSQEITVGQEIFVASNASQIYKPSVQMKNDLVYINTLLLGNEANVRFTDLNNEVLYTENVSQTNTFGKVYNVSNLEGPFNVNVSLGGENFVYTLNRKK